jgi:hypothetical protein
MSLDDRLDNRFLRAAKAGVTKGLLKNVEGGGHGGQYTVLPVALACCMELAAFSRQSGRLGLGVAALE